MLQTWFQSPFPESICCMQVCFSRCIGLGLILDLSCKCLCKCTDGEFEKQNTWWMTVDLCHFVVESAVFFVLSFDNWGCFCTRKEMVCSVIAKGTDRILACIGTSVRTALEGEKRKGRTQFNKRQRIPPVCPCTPLCGVFFLRWRNCPMLVENRRKNEI